MWEDETRSKMVRSDRRQSYVDLLLHARQTMKLTSDLFSIKEDIILRNPSNYVIRVALSCNDINLAVCTTVAFIGEACIAFCAAAQQEKETAGDPGSTEWEIRDGMIRFLRDMFVGNCMWRYIEPDPCTRHKWSLFG